VKLVAKKRHKTRQAKKNPTIPEVTHHTGGILSWAFSEKARAKLFGSRTPGRDRQADLNQLTKTERLVYFYLEEGLTDKEIANKRGGSALTAGDHVKSVLRTLRLKNRAELVNPTHL
jgi:DNA-binding NarL/FixJ family response regulator